MDDAAPWSLFKAGKTEEALAVVRTCECVRGAGARRAPKAALARFV